LNAARNIARKAAEEWAKRVESRKQVEKLEPVAIAANGGGEEAAEK
jgi:type IV secretory pathway TrbL component